METIARRAGKLVQGVILGVLLLSAVDMMVQIESGARVFRYQGF